MPAVVPGVHPVASLFVCAVVTAVVFEAIGVGVPHSVSAAVALLEVSLVVAAIGPTILPESLRHPVYVLADVVVTVAVVLLPLPVLQPVLE